MEAADCTNNNDNEVEDSEVNFYETVSEHEPSLKDIKDMLSCVQATLKDIQHENSIQEVQLKSFRESLSKATKANNPMKLDLQALREKFNEQKSTTDELYESLDDLEQYSRKNSLEIHGAPEDLYTSAEDVVIKLSELLDEPVRGKDIGITHKIYSGKNKPRNIIVKFISHKKKTAFYKRTALKNVRISQLFPHCPAATALASKRLFINENLTPFRRYLVKEANQMRN